MYSFIRARDRPSYMTKISKKSERHECFFIISMIYDLTLVIFIVDFEYETTKIMYRGGGYKVGHKTARRPYNHPLSGKFKNCWTLTYERHFGHFWHFREDLFDHSQTVLEYRGRNLEQKSRKKLALFMAI